MAKRSERHMRFVMADLLSGEDEYNRNRAAAARFYDAFSTFAKEVGYERAALHGAELASIFAKIARDIRRRKLLDGAANNRMARKSPFDFGIPPPKRFGRGGIPGPRQGRASSERIANFVKDLTRMGLSLGEIVRLLHQKVPEFKRIDQESARRRVQRAMRAHRVKVAAQSDRIFEGYDSAKHGTNALAWLHLRNTTGSQGDPGVTVGRPDSERANASDGTLLM